MSDLLDPNKYPKKPNYPISPEYPLILESVATNTLSSSPKARCHCILQHVTTTIMQVQQDSHAEDSGTMPVHQLHSKECAGTCSSPNPPAYKGDYGCCTAIDIKDAVPESCEEAEVTQAELYSECKKPSAI